MTRTLIRIPTRVKMLEERFRSFNWRKDAEGNTLCDKVTMGWWVLFEGSREALFVGFEPPSGLAVGDTVFIDITKETPQ